MDSHARRLRRFLAIRVATRLSIECVVVAVACGVAALAAGLSGALIPVFGFCGAQLFAVIRVAGALLTNPIGLRYLMGWECPTSDLQPTAEIGPEQRVTLEARFAPVGLQFLGGVGQAGAGSPRREVYGSQSRLVVVAADRLVGDDADGTADDADGAGDRSQQGALTVISRLADGRLVVTTTETIPPHAEVLWNRSAAAGISELLVSHVETLDQLRRRGLQTVRCGVEATVDQLRCEWEAWDQLGPFLGPFLAVDQTRQPHLLQVRPPDHLVEHWMEESEPLDVQRFVRYRFRRSWTGGLDAQNGANRPSEPGEQDGGATGSVRAESLTEPPAVEVFVDVPQTRPRPQRRARSRRKPVGATL